MVSPSVNPLSSPAASTNTIVGPGFSPKFPVSNGEVSTETRVFSIPFSSTPLRFPPVRRVTVNEPVCGFAEPASTIVITRVAGSTKTPVRSAPTNGGVNVNSTLRSSVESPGTLGVGSGSLVSSENVTVMVSPLPNTPSAPSGSLATNDVMDGPTFKPNVPVNRGDSDVDGSEPSVARKSPSILTCKVNLSISGGKSRFSPSIIVMTRVKALTNSPE